MSTLPPHTTKHDTPVMVIDDYVPRVHFLANALYREGYPIMTMIVPHTGARLMSHHILRALRQATHPTIILADPTTFGILGTESLTAYLRDTAQRQPHLLYLMTPYSPADAIRAVAWYCADGQIARPFAMNALLTLIADGERILRERAATPPDPFTIAF